MFRSSQGISSLANMGWFSLGGPGKTATAQPSLRATYPTAVPMGLRSTSAPSGIIACFSFPAGGSSPRSMAKIWRIRSHWSSSRIVGHARACATASVVRSSEVGPRPPQTMTRLAVSIVSRIAPEMASMSSGNVQIRSTMNPWPVNSSAKKGPLASAISPASSSSPTSKMTAFSMTGSCLTSSLGINAQSLDSRLCGNDD